MDGKAGERIKLDVWGDFGEYRGVFYPIENLAHRYQLELITALANPINTDLIGEAMIDYNRLNELREINLILSCIKILSKNEELSCSVLTDHLELVENRIDEWIDEEWDKSRAEVVLDKSRTKVVQLKVVRK